MKDDSKQIARTLATIIFDENKWRAEQGSAKIFATMAPPGRIQGATS